MNVPAEADGIRRIVLALEHAGLPPFTLELVLRLARRLDAELAATLIENSNLLRAAGFPFAREVLRHTGTERALDAARLADQLRHRLHRLQSELEASARAGGVRTSFRTVRASGVHAALEGRVDSGPGDLIFLSHPPEATPADGSRTPRIAVVQPAGATDDRVERVVQDLLAGVPADARPGVSRITAGSIDDIVAACRSLKPMLLVVPSMQQPAQWRTLIERAGCLVLVIG